MAQDKEIAGIVAKVRGVRNELKQEVVERGIEIDLLCAAVVAKVHMLMLGEPGVAKSMLVDQFLTHIDGATKFEYLLNKQTPPEALFGPISMKGLENDEFRRVTTARLPEAELAFIDEVFKSNATNLNQMLKIINERKFENNGGVVSVPLWSMIAASNELPTHDREDLIAFSDRIGIRRIVSPVRTEDGIKSVLAGQLARYRGEKVADTHTEITRAEVEVLQGAAAHVVVPNRVQEAIVKLRANAEAKGLRLSARRIFEGVKLCQAQAILAERGEVKSEDLRLFEHILPNEFEDFEIAQELTLDFAGTVGKQAARARSAYEELQKRLGAAQAKMPDDASVEPEKDVVNELTTVSSTLRKLEADISGHITEAEAEGHDSSELESVKAEVERARGNVREALGMNF